MKGRSDGCSCVAFNNVICGVGSYLPERPVLLRHALFGVRHLPGYRCRSRNGGHLVMECIALSVDQFDALLSVFSWLFVALGVVVVLGASILNDVLPLLYRLFRRKWSSYRDAR